MGLNLGKIKLCNTNHLNENKNQRKREILDLNHWRDSRLKEMEENVLCTEPDNWLSIH